MCNKDEIKNRKPYNLGAVGQRLFGVEGAVLAGKALNEDFGVLVNEYAHL